MHIIHRVLSFYYYNNSSGTACTLYIVYSLSIIIIIPPEQRVHYTSCILFPTIIYRDTPLAPADLLKSELSKCGRSVAKSYASKSCIIYELDLDEMLHGF